MKRIITILIALTLVLTMAACSGGTAEPTGTGSTSAVSTGTTGGGQSTGSAAVEISGDYDSDDLDDSWNTNSAVIITLDGNEVTVEGDGADADGSKVTITAAGTYVLSGTLKDGQVIVNAGDEDLVKIVLNGVDITCSDSSPVYVVSADKVVITLADGTDNYLTDGDEYVFEDNETTEPNAALFSHDDLTINGGGSLTVAANYNNGIQCKDDLKIVSGSITVNSVNDGIKGKDSIAVRDGDILVEAGGDGLQSNNDAEADKGYVVIDGGTLDITAGEDGIQAETSLVVGGGVITISSGGGSANSSTGDNWGVWGPGLQDNTDSTDTGSAKGLKAGVNVTVNGGTITIDSSDDSVHSNDTLVINGGSLAMTSGDDGIHADTSIEINGGDITITRSYEGIESSAITVNDGNISVVSSDDGFNAVGGVDGSAMGGRPGQNTFTETGDNFLKINGGYIVVNADGDGLDINGYIDMTDGVVIINGPTNSANGALDYYQSFTVSGGVLLAAGSSGMAMAPSTNSTQYAVMINLTSQLSAGTLIHIETGDGEDILTFAPGKTYQSVVFCSPELENGETYSVYTGGSATGTPEDGLYTGGTYTAGSLVESFTISSILTTIGTAGGGMPGGDMPGGGTRPGRR